MSETGLSPCKVCSHPDSVKLNAQLFAGTITQVQVASIVGVNRRNVYNHVKNHLAVFASEAFNKQEELIKALRGIEQKTEKILNDAMKGGNPELALKAILRREGQIKLVAEITGQLQEKAANEGTMKKKAEQLERAIESLIMNAKQRGIKLTINEAVKEIGEISPEIYDVLPLTKFGKGETLH